MKSYVVNVKDGRLIALVPDREGRQHRSGKLSSRSPMRKASTWSMRCSTWWSRTT